LRQDFDFPGNSITLIRFDADIMITGQYAQNDIAGSIKLFKMRLLQRPMYLYYVKYYMKYYLKHYLKSKGVLGVGI